MCGLMVAAAGSENLPTPPISVALFILQFFCRSLPTGKRFYFSGNINDFSLLSNSCRETVLPSCDFWLPGQEGGLFMQGVYSDGTRPE